MWRVVIKLRMHELQKAVDWRGHERALVVVVTAAGDRGGPHGGQGHGPADLPGANGGTAQGRKGRVGRAAHHDLGSAAACAAQGGVPGEAR